MVWLEADYCTPFLHLFIIIFGAGGGIPPKFYDNLVTKGSRGCSGERVGLHH